MSNSTEKDSEDYISFSNTPTHQVQERRQSNSYNKHDYRMNYSQDRGFGRRGFARGSDGGHHHHYRHQFAHSTPYSRERRSFQHNFRNSTPHRSGNANYQQNKNIIFDVTKYFNPSMLDDPWVELEKKLQDKIDNESDSSMDDSDQEYTNNDSDISAKDETSINSNCADSYS